jgi:phage gpG-like protein
MIDLTARVQGADAVVARLSEAAVNFSQRVPKTVHALGLELLKLVKDTYLTGKALNVRSGRLRRSINERFTESSNFEYKSSVGTNVIYGRFWELGFDGVMKAREVKAHVRKQESRSTYKIVKGKKAVTEEGNAVTMLQRRKASQGLAFVKAHKVSSHARKVEPRPFLQPALADMKDEIRARLVAAISGRGR